MIGYRVIAGRISRSIMITTLGRAIMREYRYTLGLWTALMVGWVVPGQAEVQVEGGPVRVHVTSSHDTISDVLSAVAHTFNAQYRTAIPLDTLANTTYSGSFGQVISRVLDGYNYVIRRERERTEIIVLGKGGNVAEPPPAPTAAIVKSVVSQWR